eukprot:scaffold1891_cov362-Prasinococcus_capsulatus_cf.AAC.6
MGSFWGLDGALLRPLAGPPGRAGRGLADERRAQLRARQDARSSDASVPRGGASARRRRRRQPAHALALAHAPASSQVRARGEGASQGGGGGGGNGKERKGTCARPADRLVESAARRSRRPRKTAAPEDDDGEYKGGRRQPHAPP